MFCLCSSKFWHRLYVPVESFFSVCLSRFAGILNRVWFTPYVSSRHQKPLIGKKNSAVPDPIPVLFRNSFGIVSNRVPEWHDTTTCSVPERNLYDLYDFYERHKEGTFPVSEYLVWKFFEIGKFPWMFAEGRFLCHKTWILCENKKKLNMLHKLRKCY